ncbi:MAG TPA: PRC and DUF2382 domain-containing protein [Actinomycetota bacterium]
MRGTPVYSSDGAQVGKVEEIFYDDDTGQPEWIGIGTGFLGTKRVLVPVAGAEAMDDRFTLAFTKEHVAGAPDIDEDEISRGTEEELYAYFGLQGEGVPADHPADEARAASVTRSEEQMVIGKQTVPAGRVRLRKWVETEPVTADVEVAGERAYVEREPINEPVADVEMGEEEVDVPLVAEEPVVGKRTVAKERVSVEKEVEVGRKTVTGEVSKEHVDVEEEST